MTDPRVRFLSGVRDEDVSAVLQLLDEPTVRIESDTADNWRTQVLLLALVDLLGRLFPRLDIAVDDAIPASPNLPPGGATLGERLAEVRQQSPLAPLAPGVADRTVHAGGGDRSAEIYVDGSGWQCYVGSRPSRLAPPQIETAVGPLAAACHAAARLYASLLATVREHAPFADEMYLSLLTYEIGSDPLVEPEVAQVGPLNAFLVGAGSVGGAAAYVMKFEPVLAGTLAVLDGQSLDESNPYRAILAHPLDAAAKAPKVDAVATALTHHEHLRVLTFQQTLVEWEATQPSQQALPLLLVAVDSREERESIQDSLPLDVVNVAVGPELVAVSGHRTGSGPCMCCLHMPQTLDAAAIRNSLIAKATGIRQEQVNVLRVGAVRLQPPTLRAIEAHRRLPEGSLDRYAGATLDNLYNVELLYGEAVVQTGTGSRLAVAAPFVTALAGVLLAGECFKRATPDLLQYALSSVGRGVQYRENPFNPEFGCLDPHIGRSPICLCRSIRRLRLTAEVYGLDVAALVG